MKNRLLFIDGTLSVNNKLRIKIACCGLIICLIPYLLSDVVLSRDGIHYIRGAEIFEEEGLIATFKHYNWPFYSILIAILHSLTFLSYENSAYLLNITFILLLTDTFVRFYWEANSKIYHRWMPAIVLIAFTGLNNYRLLIVRDWGYWAFSFLAFYYFLKYFKFNKIKDCLFWQFSILIAFLFRVEAIAFIVLLPLFFISNKSINQLVKATLFFWLIVIFLIFYIVLFNDLNKDFWGKLYNIFYYFDLFSLINNFITSSHSIAEQAIPYHAEDNAVKFVLGGLFTVLFLKIIFKLGYLYLFLLIFGIYKKIELVHQNKLVLYLLVISFFVVFIFYCDKKILAGRYTIQTVILSLMILTCYADRLLYELRNVRNYLAIIVLAFLVTINLLFGLVHLGSSKIYMKEMGVWVANNIPSTAQIVSNEIRLYYYS